MDQFSSNHFANFTRNPTVGLHASSSSLCDHAGIQFLSAARGFDSRHIQSPSSSSHEPHRSALEKLIANVAPNQAASFAKALIDEFYSLGRVFSETPESLRRVIGPCHQVIELIGAAHAAMKIGLRCEVEHISVEATDQRLIDYLVMSMGSLSVEQLRVLFLDHGNRLVGDEVLASGTLKTLTAYPRNIFRRGFELSASSILLVHNHPSGQVKPSKCDIEFTKKLKALGHQMEIDVRDHIIIAESRWFSFLRGGLM
jgi:DNA repair protein RadC